MEWTRPNLKDLRGYYAGIKRGLQIPESYKQTPDDFDGGIFQARICDCEIPVLVIVARASCNKGLAKGCLDTLKLHSSKLILLKNILKSVVIANS